MVAMQMAGNMTDKRHFDVKALPARTDRRIVNIAVLMNERHGFIRMGAMKGRK